MTKALYNILEFLAKNAHSLFFLSSWNKWYTDAILLLRRPNGRKYMESDAYRDTGRSQNTPSGGLIQWVNVNASWVRWVTSKHKIPLRYQINNKKTKINFQSTSVRKLWNDEQSFCLTIVPDELIKVHVSLTEPHFYQRWGTQHVKW